MGRVSGEGAECGTIVQPLLPYSNPGSCSWPFLGGGLRRFLQSPQHTAGMEVSTQQSVFVDKEPPTSIQP